MKIVVAALIEEQGHFLVARRAAGQSLEGYWEFPGGKLEKNENVLSCIIREIHEELNLDIIPGDIFAENIHKYEKGEIKLIAVFAKIKAGQLELRVHDKYIWLKPKEILTLNLAPADIPITQKLISHKSL